MKMVMEKSCKMCIMDFFSCFIFQFCPQIYQSSVFCGDIKHQFRKSIFSNFFRKVLELFEKLGEMVMKN